MKTTWVNKPQLKFKVNSDVSTICNHRLARVGIFRRDWYVERTRLSMLSDFCVVFLLAAID